MDAEPGSSPLPAIFANLSREILRPLDAFQAGLDGLLNDPVAAASDAERSHAQTLLTLCEDLRQLTVAYLDAPPPGTTPTIAGGD